LNYIEEHHFSAGIIRIIELDLLYVKFHNEHVIGVDILKEYQAIRKKIQRDRPYFLMSALREGFLQFTPQAKHYSANDSEGALARQFEALLISGLAQQIEAKLYIKILKPKANTKLFTDYDKALNWLKMQKVEQANSIAAQ